MNWSNPSTTSREKWIRNISRRIGMTRCQTLYVKIFFVLFHLCSIVGMHLDYLAFNTVGHVFYLIYNYGLFAVTVIEGEYYTRHPFESNPIEVNDLFFSIHAVAMVSVKTEILIWQL